MAKIVVIGSSNIDMTANLEHLPQKGDTVITDEIMYSFGGKGANQAVAIKRLGGDVSFISKVGCDSYGKMMLDNFTKEGLDTGTILIDNELSSGFAWICVDKNGDNSIIVNPGANFSISIDDIKYFESIIKNADYVLLQLEIPFEVVSYIINIAYKSKVKVILNPAPARHLPDSLLSKLYLIVPNENEINTLLENEFSENFEEKAKRILSKGTENVIVTCGNEGSVLFSENKIIAVPAQKVHALDTVAAGDTYCGALCVALSENKTLDEAAIFATRASAICVTRKGAQASIPYRYEVVQ